MFNWDTVLARSLCQSKHATNAFQLTGCGVLYYVIITKMRTDRGIQTGFRSSQIRTNVCKVFTESFSDFHGTC